MFDRPLKLMYDVGNEAEIMKTPTNGISIKLASGLFNELLLLYDKRGIKILTN